MNSTTYRSSNRPRLTTALVLIAGGVVGLLAACSSDGLNPKPSDRPPVINTGGGGSGSENDAGESSVGGSRAGSGNHAGRSNAGSGGKDVVVAEGGASGEGGEAGEAGAGPGPLVPSCPATTDLGFLNQPSSSQKAPFDNAKRLGAGASLPPLSP